MEKIRLEKVSNVGTATAEEILWHLKSTPAILTDEMAADRRLVNAIAAIVDKNAHSDSSGLGLIASERREQIEKHGYDDEHDDEHAENYLPLAAIYYAMPEKMTLETDNIEITFCPEHFFVKAGLDWDLYSNRSYKDDVQRLAIAGALIAAEIDRLKRKEEADA